MYRNDLWKSPIKPLFVVLEKYSKRIDWFLSDLEDNLEYYGYLWYLLGYIPTNRANQLRYIIEHIRDNMDSLSYYLDTDLCQAIEIKHRRATIIELMDLYNSTKYFWMEKLNYSTNK